MESDEFFDGARSQMLERIAWHAQLVGEETNKSTLSEAVMEAMGRVPRHEFVPADLRLFAYLDQPLPIGQGKTISQPFIVALMTDLLHLQPEDRVLDVGTGLGYQAAVLAELADRVYTVDILEELSDMASMRLKELGYDNVETRTGDGCRAWLDKAPFDKILVAAAPELIPPSLLHQLKPGGRMVVPAGLESSQQLMLIEKNQRGAVSTEEILAVRFSTLTLLH